MKKLLTTQEIREKYSPDFVFENIQLTFEKNIDKLKLILMDKNNTLSNYDKNNQLSFLEVKNYKNNNLVDEIIATLKDTVFFMNQSKKDRTRITQRMRGYYSDLIRIYLDRINILIEDPEILVPRHYQDPTPKHQGMELVFNILKLIKKDLEHEEEYRSKLPRSNYLTSLQVSMGEFFIKLKNIHMPQKDQISLVQILFDGFNVDWEEGDRENIKLSLQNPAIEYFQNKERDIQKIPSYLFLRSLNDRLLSNLIEQSIILKKRSRRF